MNLFCENARCLACKERNKFYNCDQSKIYLHLRKYKRKVSSV